MRDHSFDGRRANNNVQEGLLITSLEEALPNRVPQDIAVLVTRERTWVTKLEVVQRTTTHNSKTMPIA